LMEGTIEPAAKRKKYDGCGGKRMRVLALMGSPRKQGNTDILVDRVLDAAAEASAEVEKVMVADLEIRGCVACYACRETELCVHQDEMQALYPKVIAADALIFASPIYCYYCTAQLKTVIDRLFCLIKYHDDGTWTSRLEGKAALLVTAQEETSPETARFFEGSMKLCFDYNRMNYLGHLNCPGVLDKGEVLKHEDKLLEARDWGRRIAVRAAG